MPYQYTGNSQATQSPSPAPTVDALPIVVLPADGDPACAASLGQAFRVLADFSATVMQHSLFIGQYFSDGSDGNVTVTGTTTLTRDMFYNNLTVSGGVTLNTANYRIFVRGTCTIASGAVVQNNGGTSVSGLGGVPVAWGTLIGGVSGGAGGSAAGVSVSSSVGGNGGAGGGGGAAGAAGSIPNTEGNYHSFFTWTSGILMGAGGSTTRADRGMAGGAGGGGGGGGSGGGGGAGGGHILICTDTMLNNGTIKALGGNGGDALGVGNGGGGGGGGGFVMTTTRTSSGTGTITVSGGTGGAGNAISGGANGAAGNVAFIAV